MNSLGTNHVTSVGPRRRFIGDNKSLRALDTRVEAGSNTSTVTLRVVGGDEKGSLKSETVRNGHEFQGTRTRERPVLLSERAPHKNKTATVKE
jgi:hypothetical protein